MSKCLHCQQEITNQNTEHSFCSSKCEHIYNFLKNQNLDSFYIKRSQHKSSKIGNTPTSQIDSKTFDSEAFREEFITTTKDGYHKCTFYIEGISCFACVWLNENALLKQDGIIEADINTTYNTANITYDESIIKPSTIVDTIRAIGYEAYAYTNDVAIQAIQEQKQDYLSKLWVAFFGVFNVMMIDVAKYSGLLSFMDEGSKFAMHMGEFVLASLVIFYSGATFAKKAYAGLKNRVVNMEFLVYLGAMLSYIYSLWVMFGVGERLYFDNFISKYNNETYFDSCIMIIAFVLLGRYLELLAKQKSSKLLSNIASMPAMVNVQKDNNHIAPTLPRLIREGDLISIEPNERLVIDGVITKGGGYFDASVVNGESKGVLKKVGDRVVSGYTLINIDDSEHKTIVYKATTTAKNSFLGKLSCLLQDKDILKHHYEDMVAIVASYFTITILLLALCAFLFWGYFDNLHTALIIAISVIVISCPCSLALAIPISSIVALNSLVGSNIICKKTSVLDKLSKSKYFVFDKTNTLTNGDFKVISCDIDKKYMPFIYALCSKSNHVISQAVVRYIELNYPNIDQKSIASFEQIASRGISAKIDSKEFVLGNKEYLKTCNIRCSEINTNASLCYIGVDGAYIGHFKLADHLKNEAIEVINKLKQRDVKCIILSGDNQKATKNIADILNIEYKANMSVEDKQAFIKAKRKDAQVVTMVGDGLNDVLALNESDISVSFASSENMTVQSSEILLNNTNLSNIISLIDISQIYTKTIKQNLALSFGYNLTLIPVALMGYIVPVVAAICMSISSLLVVLNSIRGRYSK